MKILGIGNAIVDVICKVEDDFIQKNGLTKSIFNLIKWILIFFLIKNCFIFLRPYVDSYITNQTISDIVIFIFTVFYCCYLQFY